MKTNNTAERINESLNDNLSNAKQGFKDNLYSIKSSLIRTVTDAKQTAEKSLGQSVRSIKGRSKDVKKSTLTYVRRNPVKAVGVAALIGAALAQFFNLRKIL